MFRMQCIWLLVVVLNAVYVVGQSTVSTSTNNVSVTGSTVPTLQPTKPSTEKPLHTPLEAVKVATAVEEKQDNFHHCTACPFESDHHQCNDPFMLSKKFEVSADMCNAINADKSQIERLCKRYPKGYFFQCPKDGSSYTCKASCGVQVEDVGKGLLDADITDMPGGLLSGMGLAGSKVNAHEQNPGFSILGGMGNLLHPQSQAAHGSLFNPFGNRKNVNLGTFHPNQLASNQQMPSHNIQFGLPQPHQFVNHGQQQAPSFNGQFNQPRQQQHVRNPYPTQYSGQRDQYAAPHKSYPGPNPMFHGDMFDSQFLFPQGQLNNGLHHRQPHLMFDNHQQFNNPQQQTDDSAFQRHQRLMFKDPSNLIQPSKQNAETPSHTENFPTPRSNPKETSPTIQPVPSELPSQSPTAIASTDEQDQINPSATTSLVQTPVVSKEAEPAIPIPHSSAPAAILKQPQDNHIVKKTAPTISPQVANILYAKPTRTIQDPFHNNRIGANHPMNLFGEFHPIASQPSAFPEAPQHRPLHPYGGNGFMLQPVQQSASKATSNFHNFMGGFDNFNNGFHGFASGIGGSRAHPQNKPTGNQGSFNNFNNNIFGFRRRR